MIEDRNNLTQDSMSQIDSPDMQCPLCNSKDIRFEEEFGFYECLTCEGVWGHSDDEPELDEAEQFKAAMAYLSQADLLD